MTKDQISLLLYLETRAVDYGGSVDTAHMNAEDMIQAKEWADSGFIGFGRIQFTDIPKAEHSARGASTYWVELSSEAWHLAHSERKARAERMFVKRQWKKTSEKEESCS